MSTVEIINEIKKLSSEEQLIVIQKIKESLSEKEDFQIVKVAETPPNIVPLTMDDFNKKIDKAEYDSKMNKVKSADELKKEITGWRKRV